jgi:hypothetical protein
MIAGAYSFSVMRGSVANMREQSPLVFRLNMNGQPLVFDDVRLSVYSKSNELKGILIFRTNLVDVGPDGRLVLTDEYSSEVAWYPTAEQTRALLVGAKNFYEIEVRYNSNEAIFLAGTITGVGGLNDDAEV